jgi:hypothetical protein
MPERFEVQVSGLPDYAAEDRAVVFHGINKSGSLTLTNVLFYAYYEAARANEFFSTYRSVPRDEPRLRRIIVNSTGHSFYSGHELYASVPRDPSSRVYVTQFRNPLPRARSCHQWLVNHHGLALSFADWVVETRGLAHSQVVQLGLGYGPERPTWQDLPGEEILARAIANIERDIVWFGIAEWFEETAFTMAALCGLTSIGPWARDTRNDNRALVPEWPQDEIDLVREVCTWDFQLYDWAVERFRSGLADLRFGPELERYRRACAGQYNDRLDVGGRPMQPPPVTVLDAWPDEKPEPAELSRRTWGRRRR